MVSYDTSEISDGAGTLDWGKFQDNNAKIDAICTTLGGFESGAGMGFGARDIEFEGLPRSAKGEIEANLTSQHIKATACSQTMMPYWIVPSKHTTDAARRTEAYLINQGGLIAPSRNPEEGCTPSSATFEVSWPLPSQRDTTEL